MNQNILLELLSQREFKTVGKILEVMGIADIAQLLSQIEDRKAIALLFGLLSKEKETKVWNTMQECIKNNTIATANNRIEPMSMVADEKTYFETSVWIHAKNRFLWLLVLMLSATITGTIITKYKSAFSTIPLLVSFIPMLMDTGGNCGSQSATFIIRGLALEEIQCKDILKVIFKEFRIALLVGISLSVANGIRILWMYHNNNLAIVVALSLIVTILLSKSIGCILPIAAKKVGLDPAIMAAPLITTMVDTCSIVVYFTIATKIFALA